MAELEVLLLHPVTSLSLLTSMSSAPHSKEVLVLLRLWDSEGI